MSPRLNRPGLALLLLAACQTSSPEVPGRIVAATGSSDQSATVSSPVLVPPAVVVTSDQGNPLAGVAVTFTVTAGSGRVGATHATSDVDGRASAGSWTLGTKAGVNQVTATVPGLSGVTFQATGTPGDPAQIEAPRDSASGVVGEVVSPAPRVTVRDQYDNPVPDVLVRFAVAAGGGTVAVSEARTDGGGAVSVGPWTLGPVPGPNTLVVTIGSLSAPLVAVARAGAAAQVDLIGSGQTTLVGSLVPQAVGVRVRDRFNNPLSFLPVIFTPDGLDSIGSSVVATDSAGVATNTGWRLGTMAGPHLLTVLIDPVATRLTRTLTATALADVPALLRLVDGDGQVDTVRSLLPRALRVRITDRYGNPTAGTVTFQVADGGGSVSPAVVATGPDGSAAAFWRAGSAVGTQVVHARLSQTASLIVFVASIDNPVANFLVSVTAGANFACGLSAGGEAWCWGSNMRGQLGDGTTTDRAYAVRVQTSVRFARLALGAEASCGLTAAGRAYCWGRNDLGQLGDGTGIARSTPQPVAGNLVFRDVSAGGAGGCGVTVNDVGYCWGDGSIGQLGTGQQFSALAPVPVTGGLKFTTIRAGWFQACGIATNLATYCWGKNVYGNLGNPVPGLGLSPVGVIGGHAFVTLASGPLTVCGTTNAKEAYCWGFFGTGNFGDGRLDQTGLGTSTPSRAAGGESIVEMGIGEATCALTVDGRVLCFGNNSVAQFGAGYSGGAEANPVATKLPAGAIVKSVTMGQNFGCVSTAASIVYCWGYSATGETGGGRLDDQVEPVMVRHQ